MTGGDGQARAAAIKKIAAVFAILVMFCYLMISGAAIPTERAFVMNGIVFAAIMIDRLRLSMRICALAAFVVLVLDPASLVGVSFQMSFGAVVALIAVYETWGAQLARFFHGGSFLRKAAGYCGAVAATTLIVTFGTEPQGPALFSPSGDPTDYRGGDLSSGIMTPGAKFTVTFDKVGRFPYICALHDDMGMKGVVVVKR